jgi:D-alanyl-lipoteichoic acid acyltransferase DltB (MBOAT superfamily)
MMMSLLILWGGLTLVLIVLLIYRGTLTMHEDDQLFLDSAEAHMQKEQEDLMKKMDRLTPWVRICGAGSVLLILIIAGTWFFSNLTR